MDQDSLQPATRAVHAGRPERTPDAPFSEPVTLAGPYVAGGDLEYGRYANPTWTAFESALGALEGGRCLAFASGLAAVDAILGLVGQQQLVVAPRHSYSGTIAQLADLEARGRLTAKLVDIADTDAVIAACDDASLVWIESPTNPALEIADIPAITKAAHAAGAYVVVDNTFATPLNQRPLDDDVDLVVHSVSKYISGHSDLVMGALVTRDDEVFGVLRTRRETTGAVPGPFEAYLALRGLRTLPLRLERAQANAAEIARRLDGRAALGDGLGEVRYPGFGAIVCAVLENPLAADVWVRSTQLWVHATSLGGVESSLERRRRWKLEAATIPDGLVRLSVGIEDVDDLWRDLDQALATALGN